MASLPLTMALTITIQEACKATLQNTKITAEIFNQDKEAPLTVGGSVNLLRQLLYVYLKPFLHLPKVVYHC